MQCPRNWPGLAYEDRVGSSIARAGLTCEVHFVGSEVAAQSALWGEPADKEHTQTAHVMGYRAPPLRVRFIDSLSIQITMACQPCWPP